MSDRFWSRTLSHLPGHGDGATPGDCSVEVVTSKHGRTYRLGCNFDRIAAARPADPTHDLIAELKAQQAAHKG